MDEPIISPKNDAVPASQPIKHKKSPPQEKGRDPYDGLRPWSAITHGVGIALGILGTILLLYRAVSIGADLWHLVSFAIYGASMIGLYTASTLYHCLRTTVPMRLALRKYD
ncbi:MAG: hemolysin III family protein, partial [Oscillospiraceae bacterium]